MVKLCFCHTTNRMFQNLMWMSCNSKSSSYKTVHPKIAFLWSAGV